MRQEIGHHVARCVRRPVYNVHFDKFNEELEQVDELLQIQARSIIIVSLHFSGSKSRENSTGDVT